MRHLTKALSGTALTLALASPATLWAQEGDVPLGDEIVVTAQKRSQTLIDVPQSVSVISGATLEQQGATGFADYLKNVPSLQLVQGTPGQGRLVLRGINTGGFGLKITSEDIARFATEVDRALGDSPTGQNQFDALVSFHYNTGAIRRATLTRRHCAGDCAAAATEFARWNRAGGRVLPGLVKRRAAEAALYRQI